MQVFVCYQLYIIRTTYRLQHRSQNRKHWDEDNKITIINNIPIILFVLNNNVNRATNYRMLGNALQVDIDAWTEVENNGWYGRSFAKQLYDLGPYSGDGLGYGGLMDPTHTTYYNWNWQNIVFYTNF